MKNKVALLSAGIALAGAVTAAAISHSAFGPNGEGGSNHGQTLTVGAGGTVFELDSYLHVGGMDLNGTNTGTSAKLSRDGVPTNMTFAFSAELAPDASDLTLTYTFRNAGAATLHDVRVLGFLDAEIDQRTNTFFNEYGEQTGALGAGSGDSAPDLWQIDEPGFVEGTLVDQLLAGALGNTNNVPAGNPDDVALGLGFLLGDLAAGAAMDIRLMISEVGHSLGGCALSHHDSDPASTTVLTFSGQTALAVRNLTNLVVSGDQVVLEEGGGTYMSTAWFFDSARGSYSSNVTGVSGWSLVGAVPAGTTLAGNVLTAGSVMADTSVTVRAEYTYEQTTLADTMPVLIRNRRVLTNLVASGRATIPEGSSGAYTAIAQFWDILLTNVTENVSATATWSLIGAVPPGTTLVGNMLNAGDVATNSLVRVRAQYTYENVTKFDTLDVTIIAGRSLTNLVVSGDAVVLEESSGTYAATGWFYDGQLGSFSSNVTTASSWSLVGTVPAGTALAGNVLNTGSVMADTSVTVRAEYTYAQTTLADTQPVLVRNRRVLTNLVVSGSATILEGATGAYTSVAQYWDILLTNVAADVTATATWSIDGAAPAGTRLNGGVLVAGAVDTNTPVRLRASFAYEGRMAEGTLIVTILARGLQDVTPLLGLTYTWTLSRQTGTYFGRIRMENAPQGGVAFTRDFLLAMHPDANYRFMAPAPIRVMGDGDSYVDITTAVLAALARTGNSDAVLDPGETIEVDGVEMYAHLRISPPSRLFEVWAQKR